MKILKKISSVTILLRPSTPELKPLFYRAKEAFEKHGITVYIEENSAKSIGILGDSFEKLCHLSDIIVTIGGDGTLISGVRRAYPCGLPILGIHAGTMGFLADIDPDEIEGFVARLVAGEYRIDTMVMLEASVFKEDGTEETFFFFNDIVLSRPEISKMIRLQAYIDGKLFNNYYGDGLVISSPSGSTAYNLSSGGPIMFPLTDAYVITPLSPHSLTQRPLVLPIGFEIELKTSDSNGVIVVDGQDIYEFNSSERIRIRVAKEGANFIHRLERNYFDVLKKKLKWGE